MISVWEIRDANGEEQLCIFEVRQLIVNRCNKLDFRLFRWALGYEDAVCGIPM